MARQERRTAGAQFFCRASSQRGKKVVHRREESRLTDQTTVSFTSSTAHPTNIKHALSLPESSCLCFNTESIQQFSS